MRGISVCTLLLDIGYSLSQLFSDFGDSNDKNF